MTKNKLVVALTLPLILIPLIWSARIKSVDADVEVDDETSQVNKSPAFAVDPSDIPETSTESFEAGIQAQTGSSTQTKYHSFPYQRADIDEKTVTANCKAITWNSRSTFHLDNNAQITCHISDLIDDGDAVYLKWWIDGYDSHSLNNKEGPKTTVKRIDAMADREDGISKIYFQVCRSVFAWSDKCGKVYSWKVN
jgi:hypothetical protein